LTLITASEEGYLRLF